MKISIYELMGLIKDNKAPKKIKYGDTYTLNKEKDDYENKQTCIFLYNLFSNSKSTNDFLKKEIEILEENDEWEYIEELNYTLPTKHEHGKLFYKDGHYNTLRQIDITMIEKINLLIKNQKYLKERLDSKDESKL